MDSSKSSIAGRRRVIRLGPAVAKCGLILVSALSRFIDILGPKLAESSDKFS
jgi:hypothetical protein